MHSEDHLVKTIEESYSFHPGYKHVFWDWIALGKFDLPTLQKFALLYYEHVKVFRLYLAGAMTIMPSEGLQIMLAKIIADEFGLPSNKPSQSNLDSHPELFRKFMFSIGLTEKDWVISHPSIGINYFKDVHYALFRGGLVDETLGAITFGCEKTTPHRHSKVVTGLKKFVQSTGVQVDYTFFSEHEEIDPHHSGGMIRAISKLSENNVVSLERMSMGARISFDARKIFLDDLGVNLNITIGG